MNVPPKLAGQYYNSGARGDDGGRVRLQLGSSRAVAEGPEDFYVHAHKSDARYRGQEGLRSGRAKSGAAET
jgi:hypothetical protein